MNNELLSLKLPINQVLRHSFVLWLILAVSSLALAGIYSILPFALRTPFLAELFSLKDFFKTSLVIHVDLAVLVWFLSCSAMLMITVTKEVFSYISFTAFITSMLGSIFISLSPFVGSSIPVINNYIPILHNLAFIIGISLFLTGILLQSIITALSFSIIRKNIINLSIYISSLVFLIATICFLLSAIKLNQLIGVRFIDLIEYYELLFWGPGHILQFSYIQLSIIAWLLILNKLSPKAEISIKSLCLLQWINFILIALTIMVYLIYPIDSAELYNFFTLHMKYCGGILALLIASITIYKLYQEKITLFNIYSIALIVSIFLIFIGGFIGYLIHEVNVTIPAHYHGVIIGITVSLMGICYMLLPELGFLQVNTRQACWQMILYGCGQFIHVIALAISGGYGVLRKNPGEILSAKAKIFMGLMGIGGTIALIGGIMFVILIFKNLKRVN